MVKSPLPAGPTGKRAFIALSVVVLAVLIVVGTRQFLVPQMRATSKDTDVKIAEPVVAVPLAGTPAQPLPEPMPCAGERALAAGDYRTAYVVFSQRAVKDPSAAFHLAVMHRDALGIARNVERAERAFEHAANAGHVGAMRELARFYESGASGRSAYSRALHWYEQAALHGDAQAALALARMHAEGRGTAMDPVQALAWLELAETSGAAAPGNDVQTLRATLSGALDNNKKRAAADAAQALKARVPQAAAATDGEIDPCAP